MRTFALFLGIGLSLGSQPQGLQETTSLLTLLPESPGRQFWDGNSLYTQPDHKSDWECEVVGKAKKKINLPAGYSLEWVQGGRSFATRRLPDKRFELLVRNDADPWESLGIWTQSHPPHRFWGWRLLDRGRILAKADMIPFLHQGRASWLAILRTSMKGELEIDELVDEGVDYWPTGTIRVQDLGTIRAGRELLREDLALARLEHFEDRSFLLLPRSGVVAVFDGGTGKPKRISVVFPSVNNRDHAKKPKEAVVLGARPLQGGTLLVATRSEDAVLDSRMVFGPEKPSARVFNPRDTFAARVEEYNASFTAFPLVKYWEFDPILGDFRPRTPDGLLKKIESYSAYRNFNFWVLSKGEFRTTR